MEGALLHHRETALLRCLPLILPGADNVSQIRVKHFMINILGVIGFVALNMTKSCKADILAVDDINDFSLPG